MVEKSSSYFFVGISKAVQKGAKYAKKAKTAVSSAKTVGKRVVKKSAKAIKKRVKLNGKKYQQFA